MNELLPYEQQLASKLAEAPLPNEDGAWDAMRKMLEEDEDDKVVPPVSKGCRGAGIGMLVLALLAGSVLVWYMLTQKQHATNTPPLHAPAMQDSSTAESNTHAGNQVNVDSAYVNGKTPAAGVIDTLAAHQNTAITSHSAVEENTNDVKHRGGIKSIRLQPPVASTTLKKDSTSQTGNGKIVINGSPLHVTAGRLGQHVDTANATSPGTILQAVTTQKTDTNTAIVKQPATANSSSINTNITPKLPGRQNDTAKNVINNNTNSGKKPLADDDATNRKPLWFGAGLAMQQLIPVDGQKATPYNASGRKGSLGDYIPSIYARAYHGKKMLQVEFKYGAPQYAKDVAYDKRIMSHDSTTGITISNVSRVKKTYYHQLPVSFHYSVLPNLTIGGGFVWNRFQSAVVQSETQRSSGLGIDSLVSSKLITLKSDSATSFAKSYFQFMAEAQYTYKRFTIGARYAWGLQPYLTISSSVNGQVQKERNASLNIFIRYELWHSKKKK